MDVLLKQIFYLSQNISSVAMGSVCVGKPKNNQRNFGRSQETQVRKNANQTIVLKVDSKEVELLKLIYKDLASRSAQQEMTMQNFLLFFHKNGYWGERLFKEFDTTNSTSLTETEFINGITKIFKTSQEKKIEKLYKFFAENNFREGIAFNNFLKMLYNYPKEDLKIILNDEQFIQNEIKQNLVAVDSQIKGRRLQSLNPTDVKNIIVNGKTFRLSETESNSEWKESKSNKRIHQSSSNFNKDHRTSWKIAIGENDVEIKTTSIHHLVKKYAKSIFKHYNIDELNGRFRYEQFRDWILHHQKLYNVYYEGFHCEAWEVDQQKNCPSFLLKQMELISKAKMVIKTNSFNVQLFLVHSILIVCQQKDRTRPINIICLEGLAVSQIFDPTNGFGVQITHPQGIYEAKKFFFLNQQLKNDWMQHFEYYKGVSVFQIYDIQQKIGTGKFSIVYNGTQKATQQNYAIKVIQTFKLDIQSKKILAHETNVMKVLSHPLLVFFKQCLATKTHIYIITELVRGKDLFDLIHQYGCLQENQAAYIMEQVILGVRYIHSLGIVHRDLKPENIMVQFDSHTNSIGRVKIIDFGFADYIGHLQTIPKNQLLVGTANYISPQILIGESFDQKIDNFAIGGIFYYLLSGTLPFGCKDDRTIFHRTVLGQFSLEGKRWQIISEEAKDLITKLLEVDPSQRISLQAALKHAWFTNNKKSIEISGGLRLRNKTSHMRNGENLQSRQIN